MPIINAMQVVQGNKILNDAVSNIIKSEGFSNYPYEVDGKPHIGFGTLLPLTRNECEFLLVNRFMDINDELMLTGVLTKVHDPKALVTILEMAYQLGVPNLLKFKKFFDAMNQRDYQRASFEILDSKLAREQTPQRAHRYSEQIKSLGVKNV